MVRNHLRRRASEGLFDRGPFATLAPLSGETIKAILAELLIFTHLLEGLRSDGRSPWQIIPRRNSSAPSSLGCRDYRVAQIRGSKLTS